MTQEEDLVQVRAERTAWRDIAHEKHQEVPQLQRDKQTLQEALKEAMQAIEGLQTHATNLEGQIGVLQERVKTLERQQAKDSHNSSLPPSSDRFVRAPKSLRQKSGKKPGGQQGHQGHHLKRVEMPDMVVVHAVERCEHCQQDLSDQSADLPEKLPWCLRTCLTACRAHAGRAASARKSPEPLPSARAQSRRHSQAMPAGPLHAWRAWLDDHNLP